HLDNHHGAVISIYQADPNDRRGDITINYRLDDPGRDTLRIVPEYKGLFEPFWHRATVLGDTVGLDSTRYEGALIWDSYADSLGVDDPVVVLFRISPYDEWGLGYPDTVTITIDNRGAPHVMTVSPPWNSTAYFNPTVPESLVLGSTIKMTFNYPMSRLAFMFPGRTKVVGSVTGTHSGQILYGDSTVYGDSTTQIHFVSDSCFAAAETVTVTLSGEIRSADGVRIDGNGDGEPQGSPEDDYTWRFTIGYLGDYDLNNDIDFVDLVNYFRPAWNEQDTLWEIGPVVDLKDIPYLKPRFDGRIDFEDLTVFVLMWNWVEEYVDTLTKPLIKRLPKERDDFGLGALTIVQPEPEFSPEQGRVRKVSLEVWADGVNDFVGTQWTFSYDPAKLEFVGTLKGNFLKGKNGTTIYLERADSERGTITVATCRLSRSHPSLTGSGLLSQLEFRPLIEDEVEVTLNYELRDNSRKVSYGFLNFIVNTIPPTPKTFALSQNYPNPFNARTQIKYQIPEGGRVILIVHNILGQEIRVLDDSQHQPGYYRMIWDGRDSSGNEVGSGIYFYHLKVVSSDQKNRWSQNKKMLLIK
ncbi:hypothetical protein ISS37_04735, partial [candidate division KSB1 bacterium]|nr:hypothetical protein [candidate division KSB1 bacterium]